uniref:Uncharacterized protein n=1 Tax=Panagrellus redivivus TaxID=6233 RepID=A0A7E4WBM0_PANRE
MTHRYNAVLNRLLKTVANNRDTRLPTNHSILEYASTLRPNCAAKEQKWPPRRSFMARSHVAFLGTNDCSQPAYTPSPVAQMPIKGGRRRTEKSQYCPQAVLSVRLGHRNTWVDIDPIYRA